MGITLFSKSLIEKAFKYKPDIKRVIELGSQNDYTTNSDKPPFANSLYEKLGAERYSCIDLAGDNNAYVQDLSNPIEIDAVYDLVTDFGTGEHCVRMNTWDSVSFLNGYINSIYPTTEPTEFEIREGYYNCWLNKFNLCKEGGLIISENPLTKNWPQHSYSYLGENFYNELAEIIDVEVIEQGKEAACGNITDGWNLWSVLKKTGNKFCNFQDFNKLPIFRE